mgnify:CR=1 FL=1
MKLRHKETGAIAEPSVEWVALAMIKSGQYEKIEEKPVPKKKAVKKEA